MNTREFLNTHENLRDYCEEILGIKGTEYPSDDGDRLSNFKEVGVMLGLSADTVAMVYLLKHILSLCTFVRQGRSDEPEREPIKGRIADIQNYGDLIYAILKEQGRTLV